MNKEIQCLLNHAWAHLLAEASHCRVGRVPLQAHVSATSSHLGPARQRPGLFLAVSGQATNPTCVTRCPQPACFFPNSPEPLPCSGHARCRCDSRPCHDTGLRTSSPRPPPPAIAPLHLEMPGQVAGGQALVNKPLATLTTGHRCRLSRMRCLSTELFHHATA
jgi:hypothetical protein